MMVGAISGIGSYLSTYQYRGYAQNARSSVQPGQSGQDVNNVQKTGGYIGSCKAPQVGTPVQPVTPAAPVNSNTYLPKSIGPVIREGADPVEMAVRMRIKYIGDDAGAQAAEIQGEEASQGAEAVQNVVEEGECRTCKERKYQDGSDDMGVSFKTPTQVAPDMAASAVRGHEMEHVVREQAKAKREDRKVVSQSVTYHTAICPECGKVYVSGGTTRTTTAANAGQQAAGQEESEQERVPFSAVA